MPEELTPAPAPGPQQPDDGPILPTDVGNARRLVTLHGNDIRFVAESGWHVWNGACWQADKTGEVERRAVHTIQAMKREARELHQAGKKNQAKALMEWAETSESDSRVRAMVRRAQVHSTIALTADAFDRDPWLLNVANGTIDLHTGTLRSHRREDLITKRAVTPYDPSAKCPEFERFMLRIFGHNKVVVDFVVRFLGMCLAGDVSAQVMPIFHGEGGNGKSTLVETVCHIMGDYAGKAPDSLLTETGRIEHPTELMTLCGRRLVIASETESNARLKIQLVKRLTGDATITGRGMRQDFVTFPRTHKMVMLTNNKPRISEDTEGIWRRLLMVPFSVVIPREERDPRLGERLREQEAPGVLAWLVRGCLEWQEAGGGEKGLQTPEEVLAVTDEYRAENDPLSDFLAECCIVDEKLWAKAGDLRRRYEQWCQGQGSKPISPKNFGQRLRHRGCTSDVEKIGGSAVRIWHGLGLAVDGAEVEEAELFEPAGQEERL